MNIVNESVKHIKFGFGVITEEKDHKICVQFQYNIGTKIFQYPEAFEKFLKAVNQIVEDNVLEELRIKQEQIETELQRKEKERADTALEEKKVKLELVKKKPSVKSTKKKS